MGRRNSLSNLINLQRFRHHHGSHSNHHHKHDEESTQPVKPMEKPQHERNESSSSSSTLEDDFSAMSVLSNKSMRRHSTGACAIKSVRFGECHIRSYPQVLGDHPYCSMGCPVELGWEYSKEVEVVKINDFEEQRDHQRRHKAQLLLSPEERRSILSSGGLNDHQESAALRKACRRQCTRKAQRKIQREFFAHN